MNPNNPQEILKNLLRYKIELQTQEAILKKMKEEWRALSKKLRSKGQEVGMMQRTLIEMIR